MYIVMSFLTYIENTLEIGINDQIPKKKKCIARRKEFASFFEIYLT